MMARTHKSQVSDFIKDMLFGGAELTQVKDAPMKKKLTKIIGESNQWRTAIVTEENIKSIQDAVYSTDGMKDKHAKKIEYVKTKGLFKDFNFSKYFDRKPPKNTSLTTYQELMYLKDLA